MSKRTLKETVSYRLRMAWHNIVVHPIAGICWLLGFERLGDWIHGS